MMKYGGCFGESEYQPFDRAEKISFDPSSINCVEENC